MKTCTAHKIALTVLTMIAISSCSVDEDFRDLQSPNNEANNDGIDMTGELSKIEFGVQTEGQDYSVRGNETNSNLKEFKITAYDGSRNYFNGDADIVKTSDNGSTWTSSRLRYWPEDRSSDWTGLTFYAYTDDGEGYTREGNDAHIFDMTGEVPTIRNFKADEDVDSQKDLVYAVARDVNHRTGNRKVDLNFRHALSKVCFTISNGDPKYDNVEVLSIELGGVKGEGTFRFPEKPMQNESMFDLCESESEGEWILDQVQENRTFIVSNINVNLDSRDKRMIVPGQMLMIPQQVEARTSRTSTSGGYIMITVRVTPKGASEARSPETIFLPTSIDWKVGKKYTYDIVLDSPLMTFGVCESDF